jgi:hypothetical protein
MLNLVILFSLILYLFSDGIFIGIDTDGVDVDVIVTSPKLTAHSIFFTFG